MMAFLNIKPRKIDYYLILFFRLIEAADEKRQIRLKEFLNEKDLLRNLKGEKFSGAKLLSDKINQIK
jgi:hypothetical protein